MKILFPAGRKRVPPGRVSGPTAAFTWTVSGNLTIQFTDQSSSTPPGGLTAWLWNFGDGATSTAQHPLHTYASAGTYSVTLTVTDGNGSDDASASVTLAATGAELALPTANLLAYWYAGNGTDVPAGLSAEDGGPVAAWTDKVGGLTLAQTARGAQPTYRKTVAALNSRGALEFDGADLLTLLHSPLVANLTNYTALVVFQTVSSTRGVGYMEASTTATSRQYSQQMNNTAVGAIFQQVSDTVGSYSAESASANRVANNGSAHVLAFRKVGTAFSSHIDTSTSNAMNGSGPSYPLDFNRLSIGAYKVGANAPQFGLIGLVGAVALYSADVWTSVRATLGAHYGLTL